MTNSALELPLQLDRLSARLAVLAGSAFSALTTSTVERRQVVEMDNVIMHGVGRMIMLRMYCALTGISSCSAFSTARTEAMACTVVHAADALGDRPGVARVAADQDVLDTRHIWPEAQAFLTRPPSTDVDAQVTLDAGDRVDGDTFVHVVLLSLDSVCRCAARQHGSGG
jgi:hypothetical protein